jgi:hypothetical protein
MPSLTTEYAAPPAAVELIGDLERGGAITSHQAKLLCDGWPLDDEWCASPYLCSVRDHTRVWIDGLRLSAASDGQPVAS